MPTHTLKKNNQSTRIFKIPSVAFPVVMVKNVNKNITYKVPVNLLQPKNLLKAKLKNRANATKKAANLAKKAENARRERLASLARAKNKAAIAATQAVPASYLLRAFMENNNNNAFTPVTRTNTTSSRKRGPGARGTGAAAAGNGSLVSLPAPRTLMPSNLLAMMASRSADSTVRKANLLRMAHMASKAAPAPAPSRKPLGKFWKKEGTNNSNSSSSNSNSD